MSKQSEQVLEFHKVFNHPIGDKPNALTIARGMIRAQFVYSEVDEFTEAVENEDLIESIDANLDIIYFALGNLVELGVIDKFDALFDEVQRSNMSKLCETEQEAIDTIKTYTKENIQTFHRKNQDKWIVYRVSDGKILKSYKFSPPDLASIINS